MTDLRGHGRCRSHEDRRGDVTGGSVILVYGGGGPSGDPRGPLQVQKDHDWTSRGPRIKGGVGRSQ